MPSTPYESPVSALLTYGSCLNVKKKESSVEEARLRKKIVASAASGKISRDLLAQLKPPLKPDTWPDYLSELGITAEHTSELIRMMEDDDLVWADSESLEVWAPIHAWRCLGFLQAEEAIAPLIELLKDEEGGDWVLEEVPWVLGLIGEKAIAPVSKFLAGRGRSEWSRIATTSALEYIARLYPDLRERCINKLASQLADYQHNPDTVNGFVVSSLVELKATSKASLMERAFASGNVDESILGNWPCAQIEMGIASEADFKPEELESDFEWVHEPTEKAKRAEALEGLLSSLNKKSEDISDLATTPIEDLSPKKAKGFGSSQAQKSKRKKSKKRK